MGEYVHSPVREAVGVNNTDWRYIIMQSAVRVGQLTNLSESENNDFH